MIDTILRFVLSQEEQFRIDYVDQLSIGSCIDLSNVVTDSYLTFDDGLNNTEANLDLLFTNQYLTQIRSWLAITDISQRYSRLKLWQVVQGRIYEFKSWILDSPNAYAFSAKKVISFGFI